MDENGYCHNCPKKCFWNEHVNIPFEWKDVLTEVEDEQTMKKLNDIETGKTTREIELNKLIIRMELIPRDIVTNIETSKSCIELLYKIAL